MRELKSEHTLLHQVHSCRAQRTPYSESDQRKDAGKDKIKAKPHTGNLSQNTQPLITYEALLGPSEPHLLKERNQNGKT